LESAPLLSPLPTRSSQGEEENLSCDTLSEMRDPSTLWHDARFIRQAVEAARKHRPDLDVALFDFLEELLTLRHRGEAEGEFVMRFQQLTGPAMAKGAEDSAFYCYNRFVALNEVGGDPAQFGLAPAEFYRACALAQAHWPESMLATSTHDTKRSEDVRARLSVLSEMPGRWREAVARWSAMNERHRRGNYPDRNMEYLLYQTLAGAWPIDAERAVAYMAKASREAKAHTTWTEPNAAYDEALEQFTRGILADAEFTRDLQAFVGLLIEPGRINSLSQVLLKLTAPGVPDIYQGSELWDLSLVDPDNRRPVDFALREKLLAELRGMNAEEMWKRADEGLPKLWLISRVLNVRKAHPEWYGRAGEFQALEAGGARAEHIVAFIRAGRSITVVPRLVWALNKDFGGTTLVLPAGTWRNELTGQTHNGGPVSAADLLTAFPVALLTAGTDGTWRPTAT
jgi:(1->4)-alpha-D-glucan 1-alpha-D-glucosylmutase